MGAEGVVVDIDVASARRRPERGRAAESRRTRQCIGWAMLRLQQRLQHREKARVSRERISFRFVSSGGEACRWRYQAERNTRAQYGGESGDGV